MEFEKNIKEIEKKIHYTFKDKSLLMQAFTRSSFCNEHRSKFEDEYISNEVLEFFGDSVLSTAIISIFFEDKTERYSHGIYTKLNEGDFSNIRSKLSDKRNLSKSTAQLGLQRFLLMGEGDSKLGIENEPSVMEDLFESIIGAVYIDCGMNMNTVIGVVGKMLDVSAYMESSAPPIQSYKNALQEWCADKKHRLPAPIYKTVSESGPDHKRSYERAVIIGDRTYASGFGKNLKLADAAAAEATLEILKRESIKNTEVSLDSLVKLRELAASKKQPSPSFRDLGESPLSTPTEKEYIIECRCMGSAASATAKSKQEARALAAEKLLSRLKEAERPAPTKAVKKSTPQKKTKDNGEKAQKRSHPEEKCAVRNTEVKKLQKSPSPKKRPYQHKKHL